MLEINSQSLMRKNIQSSKGVPGRDGMKSRFGVLVLISFFLVFLPLTPLAQESQTKTSTSQYVYVASKFSIKYHKPTCKKALKILEENRIAFSKAKDAIDAGFMPCPRCKPPTKD